MSKPAAFRGLTLYFFLCGIAVLLISPFLPWIYYGLNLDFPPQVSLFWQFEHGIFQTFVFYLIGVVLAVLIPLGERKPDFIQGVIPILLPIFVLLGTDFSPYMPHVLTIGMSTAILGSALMEASYFWYRKDLRTKSKLEASLNHKANFVQRDSGVELIRQTESSLLQ